MRSLASLSLALLLSLTAFAALVLFNSRQLFGHAPAFAASACVALGASIAVLGEVSASRERLMRVLWLVLALVGGGLGVWLDGALLTCVAPLTAVTLAATQIMNAISDIKVENVSITNGRAVLYDISMTKPMMDKQSDRIAEGTWTWSFGSADVPSTLAGDRIGVAN